jgi:NADPH:quinone reductase-like Zn-dependent oxidoreductase
MHWFGWTSKRSGPGPLRGGAWLREIGWRSKCFILPRLRCLSLPASLDPILATLFNPLEAGIRWGATLPGTGDGDVVAVLGPGVRGLCVAAAAKEAGAGFVMVTGFGPRDAEQLAIASDFGADLAVDVAVEDPVAALRHAAGGLADVVVAGSRGWESARSVSTRRHTVRRLICWRPGGTRSRNSRGAAWGSTGRLICSPRWPATATVARPSTGW